MCTGCSCCRHRKAPGNSTPTYTVQLNVNIPGLGDRNSVQANIVKPTMEDAITAAKAAIIITPLQVQQTAP